MKKSMTLEYVCNELEDLEKQLKKQGGLTPSDMQRVDMLARIKKNLLKAEELTSKEEDGYSGEGSMRGSYRGSYEGSGDRGSYEGPMRSVDRGAYSERRDRMGRYSRAEGYSRHGSDELIDELKDLMEDLPANVRNEMRQVIERHENR
jgi:hypothetical protein